MKRAKGRKKRGERKGETGEERREREVRGKGRYRLAGEGREGGRGERAS